MLTILFCNGESSPSLVSLGGGLHSRAEVKGFTLIELMIGLVLIGILMMLAMPGYRDWIENTRIRSTSESIMNALQKARQESVRLNAPVSLVLDGTGWSLGCVTATATCPQPIESKPAKEGASASISVTSDNGTTLVFDPFGRRTTPAAAAGLLTLTIDSTLSYDSRDLRITVNASGSARVCDPNVSVTTDPRHC